MMCAASKGVKWCWCGVVGVIVMVWGDAVVVSVMSVVWCVVVLLV